MATIKRLEVIRGPVNANRLTVVAIVRALGAAGITLLNDDEPGVRLRKME